MLNDLIGRLDKGLDDEGKEDLGESNGSRGQNWRSQGLGLEGVWMDGEVDRRTCWRDRCRTDSRELMGMGRDEAEVNWWRGGRVVDGREME